MGRRPASSRVLAVARGEAPADLLITGGKVFVPTTKEWVSTELAIADGVVAGWGKRDALQVVDLDGAALTAGFIDAHMHLESTKLWVDEFVRTVLPRGTTAVAADPHEIANVFGTRGVLALMEAVKDLPFTFGVLASSCVPASEFESSGGTVSSSEIATLISQGAIGVAEMMNFPGVIAGDPEVMAKIAASDQRRVDGHAPGLSGQLLDAYLAAGVESDHECTTIEEAREKRRKGMWVFIRQGTASQDLASLIGLVKEHGVDHLALCTDDREPDTLVESGHVNDCVRLAVSYGVDEADAIIMATANPASYFGLSTLGSLAPGMQADICCFDRLADFEPVQVWQAGKLVAVSGEILEGVVPDSPPPGWMLDSVHLGDVPSAAAFELKVDAEDVVRVVAVEERSLTTRLEAQRIVEGKGDIARGAIVERHHGSGRVGLGFVKGFGLLKGAIASSVSHDAHNIVVLGSLEESGPRDMAVAVARLSEIGGGQVAVFDGRVIGEVALPIGGLMSRKPAQEVAREIASLEEIVASALGVSIEAPFMQLSFLGLSVIPEARLTDKGLVDVRQFSIVPVVVS